VHLTRKPISGLVTADNRAYQFTGPIEGLALVDFNSFTSLGERSELTLFSSMIDNEQLFGQASIELFLGGSGLKLRLYAGEGQNVPGGPLKTEDYVGTTQIIGGELSYPLIRERQQTLNISAYFDALQSLIDTDTNGPSTRLSYDSMRVLRAGADYVWYDLWAGADRGATNAASIQLSQGLHALGASANGSLDPARVGERTDFFKVKFDLSRTQTLLALWQQAALSLRGAVSGQYSPAILPPAEEYFMGGAHFNRGYYSGEVTGDSAMTGTVELLLDTPIPAPPPLPFNPTAQFYTFFDAGEAWNNQPGQENVTLRSTGLGVRFYPTGTPQFEFDLEGVKRLNLFPNGSGPGISALQGEAVYWMLLARF
jgi:hemolysin activation/secretion protein